MTGVKWKWRREIGLKIDVVLLQHGAFPMAIGASEVMFYLWFEFSRHGGRRNPLLQGHRRKFFPNFVPEVALYKGL